MAILTKARATLPSIFSRFQPWINRLNQWHRHSQTQRAIAHLDSHLRRDIGLDPRDAASDAAQKQRVQSMMTWR